MKKVCVVILNWNGRDLTLGCLEDLQKSDYPNVECVIVDNGSTDGSAEAIGKAFPNGRLVRNSTNLGWAGGSNQGMAWGLTHDADYVLLLNNDVRTDPAMISNLVAAAVAFQDQVVTIPKIYLGSDPGRFWFARGRVNFWTGLFSNPAFNLTDGGQFDSSPEVEYASGCCVLIPRGIAERVGRFDETFFSYVEDVDWSIRCRRAGYRIVLCPVAKLWHDVSVTGKKRPAVMRYYLTRNHLWTMRRHASLFQFASSLLFLPLRSLWRIVRLLLAGDGKSVMAELRGLKDGLLGAVAPTNLVGSSPNSLKEGNR